MLGADVAIDRSAAAIVACWTDTDGIPTLEVIDHAPGTEWVAGRLEELHDRHGGGVAVDGGTGPASTVADQLGQIRGSESWVRRLTPREYTTACAQSLDAITARTIRHRGEKSLDDAAAAAGKRTVGDGWAWSRRSAAANVCPLIAGALALYRHAHRPPVPARPAIYTD